MTRLPRRPLLATGRHGRRVATPTVLRARSGRTWRDDHLLAARPTRARRGARRLARADRRHEWRALSVQLHAAGELVPGSACWTPSTRLAEIGHTAAIYWTGKTRAAAYFTTVPWGLTPLEHVAWIEHGGG